MKQFEKDKKNLRKIIFEYIRSYGNACYDVQKKSIELFDKIAQQFNFKWEELEPKVKQLEWKQVDEGHWEVLNFLEYHIYLNDRNRYSVSMGGVWAEGTHKTLEEAKARCQRDCEIIIRNYIE